MFKCIEDFVINNFKDSSIFSEGSSSEKSVDVSRSIRLFDFKEQEVKTTELSSCGAFSLWTTPKEQTISIPVIENWKLMYPLREYFSQHSYLRIKSQKSKPQKHCNKMFQSSWLRESTSSTTDMDLSRRGSLNTKNKKTKKQVKFCSSGSKNVTFSYKVFSDSEPVGNWLTEVDPAEQRVIEIRLYIK